MAAILINLRQLFFRLSNWETWHYLAKYIPLFPLWLWYCIRARSFWFFTSSNPTLTFGGFEGESKKEMYEQLPPLSYPKTIYISPSLSFIEAEQLIESNFLHYPIAVKPDVGMMGFMFRKIDNAFDLKRYHQVIPVKYIVQEYIKYPIEVSVFYYRFPNQNKGTITGFLKKEFLEVTGDGKSTLLDIILKYPRVRFQIEEMKSKHKNRLSKIIPEGEIFCLFNALNLSRGGKLVSLAHEKDEKLLKVFDELSHYVQHLTICDIQRLVFAVTYSYYIVPPLIVSIYTN